MPFGRPLLTIAHHISHDDPNAVITLSPLINSALRIWFATLRRNRGLPYAYILGRLPRAKSLVDAASQVGLGGFHCTDYFMFGHDDLRDIINRCPRWEASPSSHRIAQAAGSIGGVISFRASLSEAPNCSILRKHERCSMVGYALQILPFVLSSL